MRTEKWVATTFWTLSMLTGGGCAFGAGPPSISLTNSQVIGVFFLASRIFRRWDAGTVLVFAMCSAALRWWLTALWPDVVAVLLLAQLTHALNFGAFFAAVMQLLVLKTYLELTLHLVYSVLSVNTQWKVYKSVYSALFDIATREQRS